MTTAATVASDNSSGLYGRGALLDAIVDGFGKGRNTLALEGASGTGKSSLVDAVASRLAAVGQVSGRARLSATHLRSETQAIAGIYTQLEALGLDGTAVMEALAKKVTAELPGTLRKVLGAALEDLAKAAGVKAEKTMGAIREIIGGKDEHKSVGTALADANRDNQRYFLNWFLEGLSAAGKRAVVVVDDLESADPSLVSLFQVLVKEKPGGVALIFAHNSESGNNATWDGLVATVRATAGMHEKIGDLDRPTIFQWFSAVVGRAPDEGQLEALVETTHGRALKLKLALEAIRNNAGEPLLPDYTLYVERSIGSLPANSRTVGELLALLSPDAMVQVDLLEGAAKEMGVDDLWATLGPLVNHRLAKSESGSISLAHSLVRATWASQITTRRRGRLLEAWYSTVRELGIAQLTSFGPAGLIPVVAEPLLADKPMSQVVEISRALVANGQFNTGLALLERSGELEGRGVERPDMLEQALLMARTRLDLGQYNGVDEPLLFAERAAKKGSPEAAEALLLRMQLALRRNSYSALHQLSRTFEAKISDVAGIVEGERIVNTAFRDCLDKPEIERSIRRLEKLRGQVSESKQNDIQRSLARSLAKIGALDAALEQATLAVTTAKSLDSLRATGNSHLALGEVLRYRGDLSAAVDQYRNAASIARAIGNRDSHIWCLLGEAAASIQSGEIKTAEAACDEVEAFLREPGYTHPLEKAHVGLLRLFLGKASEADVLARYEKLGIKWPQQFLVSQAGRIKEAIPL